MMKDESTVLCIAPVLLTTCSDTHPLSHKNCGLCQVVNNPGSCGGVYLNLLELLLQQYRLDCVKGTEQYHHSDVR